MMDDLFPEMAVYGEACGWPGQAGSGTYRVGIFRTYGWTTNEYQFGRIQCLRWMYRMFICS